MNGSKDGYASSSNVDSKQDAAYLLRRVFVPIEKKTSSGMAVFRTTDKQVYVRVSDGSIHRAIPKVNGKVAKRNRRK